MLLKFMSKKNYKHMYSLHALTADKDNKIQYKTSDKKKENN